MIILLLFVIGCSLVQQNLAAVGSTYIRGCYFTSWSQYRVDRAKYLPDDYLAGLCTHIFYAFASMNKQTYTAEAGDPADLPNGSDEGMFAKLNGVKKRDPQVKTLLSFGGAAFGTWPFMDMSSTAEKRKTFIDSAIALVRQHGFDGVDIDWEYPAGPEDAKHFTALIQEFLAAMEAEAKSSGKPRLLITAAVGAGPDTIPNAYELPELAKYIDFVNVMTYDFHGAWQAETGHHSPLYARKDEGDYQNNFNTDFAARRYVNEGMPKEKVVVGLGTYGRGWTLQSASNNGIGAPANEAAQAGNYTGEKGYAAYFEICELVAQGGTRVWHEEHKVPYMYKGNQWFGYDDVESVQGKMDWLQAQQFAGAFVWALDLDDFNGKCTNGKGVKYPLIGTIANKLAGWVAP